MSIVEARSTPRNSGRLLVVGLTKFWRKRNAAFGLIVVLIITAFSLFPNTFSTFDPQRQSLRNRLAPPTATHVLGTDNHGRDLYSRLIHGARISLTIGALSTLLAAGAGIALGLVSGYVGGVVDRLITVVMEWILAFPTILLAISMLAVLGAGMTNLVLVIGFTGIPHFARVVRSQVLSIRSMDYIDAARASGVRALRIMFRHILPNAVAAIIVLSSMRVAQAILSEAALSFLGLGLPPPTPSWGIMIAEGRQHLGTAPWVALFPGVFIMLTVLAFNLLGDGLRDLADPRLRR